MTKRFCDRCGKEVGVFKDLEFQTWWTITRHGMMDLTTELCDDCYQAKFLADTPQTDLLVKTPQKSRDSHEIDTPQTETQTETQNSNLTFEKRTMRDCYNCKRYETEGECIECHFEPKADTPQTDLSTEEFVEGMKNLKMEVKQTDCPWK